MKKKTAISLPEPLLEVVDRLAKDFGMSRQEFIHLAVEKFVQQYEPVTDSLNRYYATEPAETEEDLEVKRFVERAAYLLLASQPKEDR